MNAAPYLTLAEAAELARCAGKTLQNLMLRGVLVEGVHYFRPRGRRPLFLREALVAWIEGRDRYLVEAGRLHAGEGLRLNGLPGRRTS